MRVHWNTWGSDTGMEIGLRKSWRGSDAFIVFGVLAWMPADAQTNDDVSMCMCNGFPAGRSKQMIVTSFHDVTRISCAIGGGNYKRRAQPNLGAVIWVFWYWVFESINKPQTLYFGYLGAAHGAEHNQNGLHDLFIHMHVPRPFWGTFSQCDFSCLMLAG